MPPSDSVAAMFLTGIGKRASILPELMFLPKLPIKFRIWVCFLETTQLVTSLYSTPMYLFYFYIAYKQLRLRPKGNSSISVTPHPWSAVCLGFVVSLHCPFYSSCVYWSIFLVLFLFTVLFVFYLNHQSCLDRSMAYDGKYA